MKTALDSISFLRQKLLVTNNKKLPGAGSWHKILLIDPLGAKVALSQRNNHLPRVWGMRRILGRLFVEMNLAVRWMAIKLIYEQCPPVGAEKGIAHKTAC